MEVQVEDGIEHHTGAGVFVFVASVGLGICVLLISAAILWRATTSLGKTGTRPGSCGSTLSHDEELMSESPACAKLDDAQHQMYALDVLSLMAASGFALVLPRRVRPVILVGCLILGAVVLYVAYAVDGSNKL